MWDRYRAWAASSQGQWVIGMGFFFVALLNAVTQNWPLFGVMVLAGIVILFRVWRRSQQQKAGG